MNPTPSHKREDRVVELIAHEAAVYIQRESSGQSLITVTRAILSKKRERVEIFVSIFPTEEQGPALSFLNRTQQDFRGHLASKTKIHPIPIVTFMLDDGALNRPPLDDISRKT